METLSHRGCIKISTYHETMEIIMGRPVFTHELGTIGLANLRRELQGLSFKNSFEVLEDILK